VRSQQNRIDPSGPVRLGVYAPLAVLAWQDENLTDGHNGIIDPGTIYYAGHGGDGRADSQNVDFLGRQRSEHGPSNTWPFPKIRTEDGYRRHLTLVGERFCLYFLLDVLKELHGGFLVSLVHT
jgi:hypothetical protein